MNLTLFDLALLAMQGGGHLDPFVGIVLPPEYSIIFTTLDSAIYKTGTEVPDINVTVGDTRYFVPQHDSTIAVTQSLAATTYKNSHPDAGALAMDIKSGTHKHLPELFRSTTTIDLGKLKSFGDIVISATNVGNVIHQKQLDASLALSNLDINSGKHKLTTEPAQERVSINSGTHKFQKESLKNTVAVSTGKHLHKVESASSVAAVSTGKHLHKVESASQAISESGKLKTEAEIRGQGTEALDIDKVQHLKKQLSGQVTVGVKSGNHLLTKPHSGVESVSINSATHNRSDTEHVSVETALDTGAQVDGDNVRGLIFTYTAVDDGVYILAREVPGRVNFDIVDVYTEIELGVHQGIPDRKVAQTVNLEPGKHSLRNAFGFIYDIASLDETTYTLFDRTGNMGLQAALEASATINTVPSITFSIDIDDGANILNYNLLSIMTAVEAGSYSSNVFPMSATLAVDVGSHIQVAPSVSFDLDIEESNYQRVYPIINATQDIDVGDYTNTLIGEVSGSASLDVGAHLPQVDYIDTNIGIDETSHVAPSPRRMTFRQQLDTAIYTRNYQAAMALLYSVDTGATISNRNDTFMSISLDIGNYSLAAIQCDSTIITCDNTGFTCDYNIHV